MNQNVSTVTINGESVITLDNFIVKIEGNHIQVFERAWKGKKLIFDNEAKA